MNHYEDWQGPRCVCGQKVATIHAECRALLTEDQFEDWDRGRPLRPLKDDF